MTDTDADMHWDGRDLHARQIFGRDDLTEYEWRDLIDALFVRLMDMRNGGCFRDPPEHIHGWATTLMTHHANWNDTGSSEWFIVLAEETMADGKKCVIGGRAVGYATIQNWGWRNKL